jgi:hypothetical protein
MPPELLSMLMGSSGSGGGGANPLGYAASGLQTIFGIYQYLKSGKRPQSEIPQAALENKAIAENAYAEGMPTASYQNQQGAIQRNQTAALYKLGSTKTAASQAGNVVSASNLATGDLNAQDAMARKQNEQRLMQANSVLANYQRQQNQDKINQQVQLESAGVQNIFGGLTGAMNMSLYGGKKTATDSTSTRTPMGLPMSSIGVPDSNISDLNYYQPQEIASTYNTGYMTNPQRFFNNSFSSTGSMIKPPYK